jgi:hypothetical protein
MKARLKALRAPLVPQRVRRISGQSFSFIPHRFLSDGFLGALRRDELALYLFLVLAGNRDGVSFYGYDAICTLLRCRLDEYLSARNGLIAQNLIAFDGHRFQVLSLPEPPAPPPLEPLSTASALEEHDPATIRATILRALTSKHSD